MVKIVLAVEEVVLPFELPAASIPAEEATARFSMLATFATLDDSNANTNANASTRAPRSRYLSLLEDGR
ncbi:MAG TPA: hypothetical protein PLG60_05605 [Acidimicrobiales bacterium]|nr:MAG: hypothetical protein B7X07_01480 [Actinobacteria bacterium 21-64-8]HQT99962.1 hypothetical protein [Acidimicrobiales bacterium]